MKTTRYVAWTAAVTAGLAFAGIQPTAYADHIDGHDDCDPTFPMPIPGQEFFTGGVLFVSLIGPVGESVITNTTFDITYVSDGATPASQLLIYIEVAVDDGARQLGVVFAWHLGFTLEAAQGIYLKLFSDSTEIPVLRTETAYTIVE